MSEESVPVSHRHVDIKKATLLLRKVYCNVDLGSGCLAVLALVYLHFCKEEIRVDEQNSRWLLAFCFLCPRIDRPGACSFCLVCFVYIDKYMYFVS